LVLHDKVSGDSTSDLDSDAAGTLLRQAKVIFSIAGGGHKK